MQPRQSLESIGKNGLVSSKGLTVSITRHCNLRCRHCWVESGPESSSSHVDATTLQNTLSLWANAGVEQICLSGGEPLTHPRWQQILLHCAQLPTVHRIRLQTNGTLLTKEIVTYLARPEFSRLHLQISIDGAEPETHDLVRGPGSHVRTMNGLELISRAGLGSRTTVAFTEMAHNFEQLPQLLEVMAELKIGQLVSGTLIKGGRAMSNSSIQLPSPDQYANLIEQFAIDGRLRETYRKIGNTSCLEWFAGRCQSAAHHCSQCMESPYINTDGVLYPCGLLSTTKYGIKDIWNCSLENVAEKVATSWTGLTELSRSRPQIINQCTTCPGQNHCQSGCMGRVSPKAVDFMEVEDRCLLRQRIYSLPDQI